MPDARERYNKDQLLSLAYRLNNICLEDFRDTLHFVKFFEEEAFSIKYSTVLFNLDSFDPYGPLRDHYTHSTLLDYIYDLTVYLLECSLDRIPLYLNHQFRVAKEICQFRLSTGM